MAIVASEYGEPYADLGDEWLLRHVSRLRQKHLQFGRHCRLDIAVLLERAARSARAVRPDQRVLESPSLR
jgi:hypothetical protein